MTPKNLYIRTTEDEDQAPAQLGAWPSEKKRILTVRKLIRKRVLWSGFSYQKKETFTEMLGVPEAGNR